MRSFGRRLGLLVPAADVVVEADFHRFLPDGVTFHTTRLYMGQARRLALSMLRAMVASALPAARNLAATYPELILFCCTSGSFLYGYGSDRRLARRIRQATGIPAMTTSTAVMSALRALGARTIFLLTPYPREWNQREVRFLNKGGIAVAAMATLPCEQRGAMADIAPYRIARAVLNRRQTLRACDAVFISCTNLRALEIVEDLEARLQIPVVTSNSATMWAALRTLGMRPAGVPGGRLFRLRQSRRRRRNRGLPQ